jgi:hypothetical protein
MNGKDVGTDTDSVRLMLGYSALPRKKKQASRGKLKYSTDLDWMMER